MTNRFSVDPAPIKREPVFRVTQYEIGVGLWTGQDYTLQLEQDLVADYFVMIWPSAESTGVLSPDEYSSRVVSDPLGTGDLDPSGAADQIVLRRGKVAPAVNGLATVVVIECLKPTSADGFRLRGVLSITRGAEAGAGTFGGTKALPAGITDLSRVVPFGGWGGGGCSTVSTGATKVCSILARLYITAAPDLLHLDRVAGLAGDLDGGTFVTYIVEWGANWTVQNVQVTGVAGGAGLNAVGHFNKTAITPVLRNRSWVFGTWNSAERQPVGSHVLCTLGDGVNELVTESFVASGKWVSGVAHDSQIFVMTHPLIDSDWAWQDLDNALKPEAIAVQDSFDSEAYRQEGTAFKITKGARIPHLAYGVSNTTDGEQTETLAFSLRNTTRTQIEFSRYDDDITSNWTYWASSIDLGAIKVETFADDVGGPQQYLIIPDLEIDGSSITSVTTEDGYRIGPITPSSSNLGRLIPFHTGDPNLDPIFEYQLASHGDLGEAGWIFAEQDGTYYGWNGYDFIWGIHTLNGITSNRYGITAVYSSVWDRLIACYLPTNISDVLTFRYYDQDGTPYESFALSTSTVTPIVTAESSIVRMLELDDGTLLCAVLVLDTHTAGRYDWQIQKSSDGGTVWVEAADAIIRNSEGQSAGVTSLAQSADFAASGDWIRLVWTDSSDQVHTMVSSSRGGSWKYLGVGSAPITVDDNGSTWDENGIAMVGINDGSGTFLLWAVRDGAPRYCDGFAAARDDEWLIDTDLEIDNGGGSSTSRLAATMSSDGIFVVGYTTLSPNIGLSMYRFDVDDPTNTDLQYNLGAPAVASASTFERQFHSMVLMDGGRELCFVSGLLDSAGTAWDDGILVARLGGWSQRAVEEPSVKSGAVGTSHWASMWGADPDAAAGSRMIKFNSGTTVTTTNSDVELFDTTAGHYNYWELFGVGASYKAGGLAAGAIVKVQATSGNAARNNAGIYAQIKPTAGATGAEFWVACTTTMVALWDLTGAPAEKAYISTPAISTSFYEVRVGLVNNNEAVIAARRLEGRTWRQRGEGWTVSSKATLALTAATTMDAIQWGHQPNNSGADNTSNWREFWCTEAANASDLLQSDFLLTERRGRVCVPRPQRIRNGVDVYWGGEGGFKQDAWTGRVSKAYGYENLFIDSPSFYWQAAGQTQQTIVIDYGAGRRTHHEAMALIGTRGQTAEVQYNTANSWTRPLSTYQADATVLTSGVVGRVDGMAIELVSADQSGIRAPGALFGAYLRITSGTTSAPDGLTWRIRKDGNGNWLHLEGTAAGTYTSLSNYNIQAGDSVEVFADRMAVRYGEEARYRYCRIVFSEEQTWNGKHALSNIVAGPVHDFDPPLDWTWKDNQQPNTSRYATKSAVSWAYQEGAAQRVFQGRLVGDYTQRNRESYRNLLNEFAAYDVKPMALVLDHKNLPEKMLFGYITTGGQLDNEGYYVDADGNWRGVGDIAIQMVEQV